MQCLPQAASLISPAACLVQERAAREHDAAAGTQLRMIGFQEQITMLQEELTKLAPEAAVLKHQRDTLQSEVGFINIAAGLVQAWCSSSLCGHLGKTTPFLSRVRHLICAPRHCEDDPDISSFRLLWCWVLQPLYPL